MGRIHAGTGHAVRLGTKKRQHSQSPTSTWPWSQVPEDATTRLNNPSDMLSSLEEIRTKLEAELRAVKLKEAELCVVKFYMNHLKTTATYVWSPFAQRPLLVLLAPTGTISGIAYVPILTNKRFINQLPLTR